ncbi:class I adenylate-forming enzyme family protein [Ferrimonas pelagia]|uniref:Class I adenylate-forming enzyme family protein n=1 Tax=Ferrimonas pelagia TaxID=1177826 RepID=A0ABP9ERJ8_9GAMM
MSGSVTKLKGVLQQLTQPGAPFETVQTESGPRFKQAIPTLPLLYQAGLKHGDASFLVGNSGRYSFVEALATASKLAARMHSQLGVEQGDRVAIAMRNSPEWALAFMATTLLGAVAVPLNSWGSAEELEYGVKDSGAHLVFADPRRFGLLAPKLPYLNARAIVVEEDGDWGELGLSWTSFLAGEGDDTPPQVQIAPSDLAMIMYTSGTTGRPKGAASTHDAICQGIMNGLSASGLMAAMHPHTMAAAAERGLQPATLLCLPLFHVSGLHAGILTSFLTGTKVVILYKWDPLLALQTIHQEKVASITAAAKQIWDLLEHPQFAEFNTSSIINLASAGTAQPTALVDDIKARFPGNFFGTGYGMTETNAFATLISGEAYHDHLTSVGLPLPAVEVKICDEQGNEMPQGEVGEIYMRGSTLISHYWGREEATAEAMKGGWIHSGDVGYFDAQGLLYISDRKKDMVIRGGENIYCGEVENVVLDHPAVAHCAVFGLPHDRLGEELSVAIELAPGAQPDQGSIQAHVAAHLAHFKVPSRVFFAEQPLPRNAVHKIQKHLVRAQYLST